MPIYNLIENSDLYLKASRSLRQRFRGKPALGATDNFVDFPNGNNDSILFKFKQKITEQTGINDTKDVEIMVPLKCTNELAVRGTV